MGLAFKVAAASVFISGKGKIGELREVSVSAKTQGERANTSDGTVKSKGAVVTDVDFSTIVPVKGLRIDMFQLLLNQDEITIIAAFNGKTYATDGTFDEATFKSVVQSGMSTGDFKFGGGELREV